MTTNILHGATASNKAYFIRSHGCPCRITAQGFKVAGRYSDGRRCRWQVTTLRTNADIYAWLGY